MGNLKVHDKLDIQAGGQVEVLDEFGSGVRVRSTRYRTTAKPML